MAKQKFSLPNLRQLKQARALIQFNKFSIIFFRIIALCSINLFQMLPESTWKKQDSILSQDASNLSILKKQICKQSEIDASVQSSISLKITSLKETAAALAKKLQNEKHKNAELEFIIGHMRKAEREQSNGKQNGEGGIPVLENRVKKLEYDLGQLNSKANRIAESVQDKRQLITQNRTERVIDSGIFRNIEIQLIQAELRFKKLLLQKVVHQNQYEKEVRHYEELKVQAQNYSPAKQEKMKAVATPALTQVLSPSPPPPVQRKTHPGKKYTNISHRKSIQAGSMTRIEDEHHFQTEQRILVIKKLLVETGLGNQQQLIDHFFRIDELSDRAFNQMNACIAQCSEIEAYLEQAQRLKKQKKIQFYRTGKKAGKQEAWKVQLQKAKTAVEATQQQISVETEEITAFFNEQQFQRFTALFGPAEQYIPDLTEPQLDQLKNLLQALQKKAQQVLGHPEQKKAVNTLNTAVTQRSKSSEKLQDLITKARKNDQNLKVMKREDFQDEYHKIIKNASKNTLMRKEVKRKSNASLRR